MQNLTLNLNLTQHKLTSATPSNQTHQEVDDSGLTHQKAFASVLSNQLLQQRKIQQTSTELSPSEDKPFLDELFVEDLLALEDAALMDDALPLESVPDMPASAPLQEMLLMQMQAPMAVNAAVLPAKMNVMDATDDDFAFRLDDANGPITGGAYYADMPSDEALGDAKRPLMADVVARYASNGSDKTALTANKAAEFGFKESMHTAAAALVSQAAPTHNRVESSSMAQAAATSYGISQAFGKPEWSQAVNQRVVWMVGAGEQSATLTLNPPELGPLKVVVQVDNQFVNTTFSSDDEHVRRALEDGMQMLRDKMQESGLQLGNAQINSGNQFERNAQQAAQEAQRQRTAKSGDDQLASEPAPSPQRYVSQGLVDTFA